MTPEGKIKKDIAEYIALNHKDVVFWYQPTTGIFDGTKYRKPSKFEMPGKSDIIFFIKPYPIAFWLEIKAVKGKQSADQKMFESIVTEKLKSLYFIASSTNDVHKILCDARFYAHKICGIKNAD